MRHRHALSPGDRLAPSAPASATSRSKRDRFRVSFAGNSFTSRETVERYLLFRAAELTVQNGFDHFILVDRDTDKQTRTYTTPGGFGGASAARTAAMGLAIGALVALLRSRSAGAAGTR